MKLRCGGQHADTDRAEYGVEGGGELRVPVPDQVSEPVTGLLKLTGEIAGELGRPLACGVCRDAEQLHPPGPCLDDERDIRRWRVNTQSTSPLPAAWRRARAGKHARTHHDAPAAGHGGHAGSCGWWRPRPGVRADAARPGCVLLPSAGSPAPAAKSARRARPGSAGVPAAWAGATSPQPCGGASAAACPGSRSGGPEAPSARPRRARQAPPGHSRTSAASGSPAQYCDLVPEYEYLRVLGRGGPHQQRKPRHHDHQQPVSQRDAHERRSWRRRSPRSNR